MLIVDMPLPTRCGACKCRHVEFDIDRVAVFCAIKDNEYVEDPDSIPSWCPIKGELVRCGECGHYHNEDDPPYCDELCTIHVEKTDGCLRGIKRGGKVGYRAADGERKDGEHQAAMFAEMEIENKRLQSQVPRWIPVTERMPENDDDVLVFSKYELFPGGDIDIMCYYPRAQRWEIDKNVTHWMPLPKAPDLT